MIEKDLNLQKIYDENVNVPNEKSFLTKKFDPFGENELYFVTGQSGYFNKQIESNGLNHVKVEQDDALVLTMLHSLVLRYGSPSNYGKIDSIIYVAAPGTLELSYARQSFPAGILEDILDWQGDKKYPYPWYTFVNNVESVDLVVGESESDYWMRVVQKLIDVKKEKGKPIKFEETEITDEQLSNFMTRVRGVFSKFCTGTNRLYFLPIDQLLDNKVSYFAEGIREGKLSSEEYEAKLASMSTLKQTIDSTDGDTGAFIERLKSSESQWGIAMIGDIECPVRYVDIKTTYQLLQEYFLSHEYKEGKTIDYKEVYKLFDTKEHPDVDR